jgi:hypothetical protein
VASREIPDSSDLAAVLVRGEAAERRAALHAVAILVAELSACGARHHDLNVKNVLLARSVTPSDRNSMAAYVLDVDRVEFGQPGDSRITERNLDRLMRSARKWRELHGARADERELAWVAATVRRLVSSRPSGEFLARTRT